MKQIKKILMNNRILMRKALKLKNKNFQGLLTINSNFKIFHYKYAHKTKMFII